MAPVVSIENESHFQTELLNAGRKVVVVDFTASWCPPCQRVAPFFQQMANKYHKAVFLKVDVDRCAETAAAQGVTAMPTFLFFRDRLIFDRLQGADTAALEQKIVQYYGTGEGDEEESFVPGHMDLSTFIAKNECECLNESDEHTLVNCFTSKGGYLASDCDEQLIISVTFNQAVKVHSLKIKGPMDKGPRNIKIFINQPRTLDFDRALANEPVQDLILEQRDLEGNPIPLRFVKFQNVQNMQLFVMDNQRGGEVTQIDHLAFYGTPISTTNMGEFKRVAGKEGESH